MHFYIITIHPSTFGNTEYLADVSTSYKHELLSKNVLSDINYLHEEKIFLFSLLMWTVFCLITIGVFSKKQFYVGQVNKVYVSMISLSKSWNHAQQNSNKPVLGLTQLI